MRHQKKRKPHKRLNKRQKHYLGHVDRMIDVVSKHGYRGYRMCGRKTRYESEQVAKSSAGRLESEGAPPLRAYKCPICKGWHLTKVNGSGDDRES